MNFPNILEIYKSQSSILNKKIVILGYSRGNWAFNFAESLGVSIKKYFDTSNTRSRILSQALQIW